MTRHLPVTPLFTTSGVVAARTVAALDGGPDVVYAPAFWRLVMLLVRAVPEAVAKRLGGRRHQGQR
jgi:hypothetical protein